MTNLRTRLSSEDPAAGTMPYSDEQSRLLLRRIKTVAAAEEVGAPARPVVGRRLRHTLIGVTAVGMLAGGGIAIATLQPVDEAAERPLAPPLIVSGVGPATVPLSIAPEGAKYVKIELACFDGARCGTPAGSVASDPSSGGGGVTRGALPITGSHDVADVQELPPIDPAAGVPVLVEPGTHWRIYAVYASGLEPAQGELVDGQTFGIPGLDIPDYVPVEASNGQGGWVKLEELTSSADVRLTDEGVQQPPLEVYAGDGETVIGEVDVSRSLRADDR